jgi:very-short-patch-repair endonuclease
MNNQRPVEFGSPIESAFASALFSVLACEPLPVSIEPQAPVGPYFADFLLSLRGRRLAVECDGREFHSSDEQRRRDQQRDEFFLRRGIPTLRLTGAQIHENATACARRTLDALSPPSAALPSNRSTDELIADLQRIREEQTRDNERDRVRREEEFQRGRIELKERLRRLVETKSRGQR